MSATAMSDLTAPSTVISDFFHNDDYKTSTKVDDANSLTTGVLANDVGTGMLTAFKTMQTFEESASGSFGRPAHDPRSGPFLQGEAGQLGHGAQRRHHHHRPQWPGAEPGRPRPRPISKPSLTPPSNGHGSTTHPPT